MTRLGGRIVMGNWIPGDPTLVAQILKISAAYSPPPPEGFVSPVTWGVENDVVERFAAARIPAERISHQGDLDLRPPGSPRRSAGDLPRLLRPTMNAYAPAAAADGRDEQFHAEMEELVVSQNRAADGTTAIPATYLQVVVQA